MKLSIAKTFTTILRGITLSSKFILTIGLAKFLTPEEFGLYGLFFATIVFCMMVVGFDFYCYSTREIIVSPRYHWVVLIRNQVAFCMVSYFLILPACSILFATGLLPWSLAGWFIVLLALEYAAQEANRLLVAMSEQVLASIVLFIRQGLWALVAFSCMCLNSDARNLTFVFYIWATGVFASFVLASIHIQSFRIFHVSSPIDWIWIKRGLSISLPFFIGTISMQAIYTIDRYLIERICGLDALAAYVFFMSIANAIFSFLDASVFSFSYPKLISTGNSLSEASFLKEVKSLAACRT